MELLRPVRVHYVASSSLNGERNHYQALATLAHPPLVCSLQAGAGPGDGCYNAMLHPQPSILSPTH